MQTSPQQQKNDQKDTPLWIKGATIANGNCGYHAFAEIFVRLVRDNPGHINSEFFNPKNPFFAPARAFLKESLGLTDNFTGQDLQRVFLELPTSPTKNFSFNSGDIAQKVAPIFLLLNVQQYKAVMGPPPLAPIPSFQPSNTQEQSLFSRKPPLPPSPQLTINQAFFADGDADALPPPAARGLKSFTDSPSFTELKDAASSPSNPLNTLSKREFEPLLSYVHTPQSPHHSPEAQDCFLNQSFPYVAIEDFRCLQRLLFKPLEQDHSQKHEEPELKINRPEPLYPFLIGSEDEIRLLARQAGQNYAMYMPTTATSEFNHFEFAIQGDQAGAHPLSPAMENTAVSRKTQKVSSATIAPPSVTVIRRMEADKICPIDIILSPTAKHFFEQYQQQEGLQSPANTWKPYSTDSQMPLIDTYHQLLDLSAQLEPLTSQHTINHHKIRELEEKIAICAVIIDRLSSDNCWNIDGTIISLNPLQPLRSPTPQEQEDYRSHPAIGAAHQRLASIELDGPQYQPMSPIQFSARYSPPRPLASTARSAAFGSTDLFDGEVDATSRWAEEVRDYSRPIPYPKGWPGDYSQGAAAAQAADSRLSTPNLMPLAAGNSAFNRAPRSRSLSVDSLESVESFESLESFSSVLSSHPLQNISPQTFGRSGAAPTLQTPLGLQRAAPHPPNMAHTATAHLSGVSSRLKIQQLFNELEQKSKATPQIYQKESSQLFHVGSVSIENTSTKTEKSLKISQNPSLLAQAHPEQERELIENCIQCFQNPNAHIELNISCKSDIENLLDFIKKTDIKERDMSYSFALQNSARGSGHAAIALLISQLQNANLPFEQVISKIENTLAHYPSLNKSLTGGACQNAQQSPRLAPSRANRPD